MAYPARPKVRSPCAAKLVAGVAVDNVESRAAARKAAINLHSSVELIIVTAVVLWDVSVVIHCRTSWPSHEPSAESFHLRQRATMAFLLMPTR